ncbi:hypothetical protein HOA92_02315 [archaeon]|jgi:quercetin dioxygenase-like cupin family protein|nr:hypothetical protein [archaeon]
MNGYIRNLETITHQGLAGVVIRPMQSYDPKVEIGQDILVTVEANGIIPLHTHQCEARMYIVAGNAEVLSTDSKLHGKYVDPGVEVYFEANVAHGFAAGKNGLTFVSRNGGIVDKVQENWDIKFTGDKNE